MHRLFIKIWWAIKRPANNCDVECAFGIFHIAAIGITGLLVIPFGKLGRNCGQITEQPNSALIRPCGEIHLCSGRSRSVAVAGTYIPRTERPDSIDRQRFSAGVLQYAFKFSCGQVIRCDVAARLRVSGACELADEQIVAESPEIKRSKRHAPWSI